MPCFESAYESYFILKRSKTRSLALLSSTVNNLHSDSTSSIRDTLYRDIQSVTASINDINTSRIWPTTRAPSVVSTSSTVSLSSSSSSSYFKSTTNTSKRKRISRKRCPTEGSVTFGQNYAFLTIWFACL